VSATSQISSPVFGSWGGLGVVPVVVVGVVVLEGGARATGGVGDSVCCPFWVDARGAKKSAHATSASAAVTATRALGRTIAGREP
jgi:hypothetical protein